MIYEYLEKLILTFAETINFSFFSTCCLRVLMSREVSMTLAPACCSPNDTIATKY